MRKMLLLGIWLSSVRGQQSKIQLSAQEGGLVKISCRYDSGYETYPKYFCKGDYGKRRKLAETLGTKFKESKQKGKYYLYDDTKQRILHVTIHDLSLNDGGTYWCEIDAYMYDPITEIKLRVYKAPAPLKPPLVTSNPLTFNHSSSPRQESAGTTVSESACRTALCFAPSEDTLTGKEQYLAAAAAAAAAAAVLLLSLVLYFRLRKHRHDTTRATLEHEADPRINTCSTQFICVENHSRGQPREVDPSVNISSPGNLYAAVTGRRGPGPHTSVCHPVSVRTWTANPSAMRSCLQDDASARKIMQCEANSCSASSPSTDAGDQHISEDCVLYSTVCF
ncbi:CMRF35-like molecule 9 isoform X3 [Chelmon rostratus]|uniref:CMRF35-like molecule 9 isoform X3 n=1 Tax=Chelmon rostratus TaxID=109905 RepID=UPI001BECF564|nr:CMRF35-like molecule 9 isoform X3 [Chelmon rostratus]